MSEETQRLRLEHRSAIRFYTEVLGLELTNRSGTTGPTVQAERRWSSDWSPVSQIPAPGTKGSVQIGLVVSRDELDWSLSPSRLRKHGIEVSDVIKAEANHLLLGSGREFDLCRRFGIQTSTSNMTHTMRWARQRADEYHENRHHYIVAIVVCMLRMRPTPKYRETTDRDAVTGGGY